MKILVTGGREYRNADRVRSMLCLFDRDDRRTELIHGAALGADSLAAAIAADLGWKVTAVPADWHVEGRAAGPIRNARMIAMKPDVVVAFPGGKGTADCVRQAKKAGLTVVEVDYQPVAK